MRFSPHRICHASWRTLSDTPRAASLKHLEAEKCDWLLNKLHYFRAAHKVESEYQLWQEGSHPQAILSNEMILQKLEYLHNNPVKRGLVASPEHWLYSSAHEWLPGAVPALRCDPWR
jgi:hypothetical protein